LITDAFPQRPFVWIVFFHRVTGRSVHTIYHFTQSIPETRWHWADESLGAALSIHADQESLFEWITRISTLFECWKFVIFRNLKSVVIVVIHSKSNLYSASRDDSARKDSSADCSSFHYREAHFFVRTYCQSLMAIFSRVFVKLFR
jgi:hypothetical protein